MLRFLALALLVLPLAASEWGSDYQAALETAKKEKKNLLLNFTGSGWCTWCVKLKKEVFDTQEFKDWAGKSFVLVELDFPRSDNTDTRTPAVKKQNNELAATHKVQGYPTVILLGPDGEKLGELGYTAGGSKAWIARAKLVMAAGKDKQKK
jgi:protein disulfide-isomerase